MSRHGPLLFPAWRMLKDNEAKRILGNQTIMRHFIHRHVPAEWAPRVRDEHIEFLPAEHFLASRSDSGAPGRRFSDLICRIRHPERPESAGALLLLLLEAQSTRDARMPLRMLEYVALCLRRHWSVHEPLPLVLPTVFYTGAEPWGIATGLAALRAGGSGEARAGGSGEARAGGRGGSDKGRVGGRGGSGGPGEARAGGSGAGHAGGSEALARFQPRMEYLLVSIGADTPCRPEAGALFAALLALLQAESAKEVTRRLAELMLEAERDAARPALDAIANALADVLVRRHEVSSHPERITTMEALMAETREWNYTPGVPELRRIIKEQQADFERQQAEQAEQAEQEHRFLVRLAQKILPDMDEAHASSLSSAELRVLIEQHT